MTVILLALSAAASSYPPAPSDMTSALEQSSLAGEFRVVALRNVVLEDGFPTTEVELESLQLDRTSTDWKILVLPGGWVEGVRIWSDAPDVTVGDTYFLFLTSRRVWNVKYGFERFFYRKVATVTGTVMVDLNGRAVTAVPCDARIERQVVPLPLGGLPPEAGDP